MDHLETELEVFATKPAQQTNGTNYGTIQPRAAQTTSNILMIEPTGFRFNFATATDNGFQQLPAGITPEEALLLATNRTSALQNNPHLAASVAAIDAQTHQLALQEFNDLAAKLREKLVNVLVIKDDPSTDTPDSIFPNNPISFHEQNGGTVVKHLMRAENRKLETNLPIPEELSREYGFQVSKVVDLRDVKDPNGIEKPLEGTGSMVIDRENGVVYACLSQRTTSEGLDAFATKTGYKKVIKFTAQTDKEPVYHTNVMMSVGKQFAVICFDSIPDPIEREMVRQSLVETGKEIIEISLTQMNNFAGNILEIEDTNRNSIIAMSQTARNSFTNDQIIILERFGEIVSADISNIERNGGGSVRCMLAEIFLPKTT